MSRPKLEVADVFRRHGAAWRAANKAHLSLAQRRVMPAIEACRTAALGGHVERCEACAHTRIAYNSCRNRHCPKCQWPAAQAWMAAREAELLPVPYFHVVFTLPAALGAIAYQNKAKLYALLFTAAAETLTTIAGDPKHLGADIGVTAVLHTWGQNLQHHPHVHCIVPGGGLSPDGERWIASRNGFFLPARACFAACSCKVSKPCTPPTNCSSSPISASSNTPTRGELTSRRCARANGWSMPKSPSPVLCRSWPISRAIRIASRSPTAVCSISTRPMSVSAGRTIARTAIGARSCVSTSASSCAASCSTSSQPASIASVTTACSPTAIAPTSSNSVDGLSMCHRRQPRTPTAITPARPPPTTNRHLAHAAVVP